MSANTRAAFGMGNTRNYDETSKYIQDYVFGWPLAQNYELDINYEIFAEGKDDEQIDAQIMISYTNLTETDYATWLSGWFAFLILIIWFMQQTYAKQVARYERVQTILKKSME
jgi:hypothetical protein